LNFHTTALGQKVTGFVFRLMPGLIVLLALILTSVHSFLLFHISVEVFSLIIAASLFLFAWNTKEMTKNGYFLFIGIAFLFSSIIGFLHMMTYKGMDILIGNDANVPTQLWLAQRYLISIALLVAPVFLKRKFNTKFSITIFGVVTSLLLAAIFVFKIFPVSYIEGVGLTGFKKISEAIISLIFLAGVSLLNKNKHHFDERVFRFLMISFALNVWAEVLFASYSNVYDALNITGHIAVTGAYFFIYKAVLETGLKKPYQLLFLELDKSNKRKDEFLNIASHELKTPITSIKAYSQALAMHLEKSKDKNTSVANKIDYQADRIVSLINDLLDVSRIETGKFRFDKKQFNFNAMLRRTVNDLKRISEKHLLIIESSMKRKVAGDEIRLSQAITNLITNAIKYSPKGGRIIIRAKENKDNILVSVQDFGIGIPTSKKKSIFKKYYRTSDGEKKADGLGLGLYITKEIAEGHGGEIWVESQKGKGSTFFFTLPLTN
jgi:signal transduction histidine kinase